MRWHQRVFSQAAHTGLTATQALLITLGSCACGQMNAELRGVGVRNGPCQGLNQRGRTARECIKAGLPLAAAPRLCAALSPHHSLHLETKLPPKRPQTCWACFSQSHESWWLRKAPRRKIPLSFCFICSDYSCRALNFLLSLLLVPFLMPPQAF